MAIWSDRDLATLRRLLAQAADAIARQRKFRDQNPVDTIAVRSTIRALRQEVESLHMTLELVGQLLVRAQATLRSAEPSPR